MIDKCKFIDIDSSDKYLHSHMVHFPSPTLEKQEKHTECGSSNNCLRSCRNSILIIMLFTCLLVWCGLFVLAFPGLSGAGSLKLDDGFDGRAETAHHGNTGPGNSLIIDDSTVDARFAALESVVSGLQARIEDLDKRNRRLEAALLIERKKPQPDEELKQLVDQLERGLSFLFPDFNEGNMEATRHLSSDERVLEERLKVLRDYLGNREAELAELRPDLAPELDGAHDTAAPPDLGSIGAALQQLSNENAVMKKRLEELSQQVTSGGERGGGTDEEIDNVVKDTLLADRYVGGAEQLEARAADTRKSAFSVASSQPQLGLQGQMQYVIFDHTLSNKGGDFLFTNNSFLCRLPGFYFFTFTLRTYDHRYLAIVLMKNDDPQVAISTDQSDRTVSSSQSTILKLSAGDSVWLRLPPSENYAIYSDGAHYTTFSGFLVFATTT